VVPVWDNYHNSDDNFPASNRGSPHTLRCRPNLGSTDSHRSTSGAAAEAGAEVVAGEAVPVSLLGNHRNSDDNFATSILGSPHTLRWRPSLGTNHSDHNKTLCTAEVLALALVS